LFEEEIQKVAPLWSKYVRAKRTLLQAKFVRSFKSTEADFAEWLVATLLNGKLACSKSHADYDVDAEGKRIQVKSVTKMPGNPNGYIIKPRDKRNNPTTGATHYAFVFFDELIPEAIFVVPESFVRNFNKSQIKRRDLDKTDFVIVVDLSAFKTAVSMSDD